MSQLNCMVCSDKRKYFNAINEVRCINVRLNKLKKQRTSFNLSFEQSKLYGIISYDKKNIKFMCGRCPSVNINDLKNQERNLHYSVISAIEEFKNGDMSVGKLSDIRRLIQGHYPIIYREITKVLNENKKKIG